MYRSSVLIVPVPVAILVALAAAEPKKDDLVDLVTVQKGQLPIILSAPHGGQSEVPNVPLRKGEGLPKTNGSGFFTGRDVNTDQLALALAAAVEKKMGRKPYLVVARFSRKYIDANRPVEIAYENPKAKPVYDTYHRALADSCKEVQKTFGRGLLLDIHGQGSARDTIFRGTKDGKTVKLLIDRYGVKAHDGSKSFFGLLAAGGMKVFPTVAEGGKERGGFTGGFIVQTYGSHTAYGIDAIQLEFGGDYSDKAKIKGTAEKLAEAIDAYSRLYLPEQPREKP